MVKHKVKIKGMHCEHCAKEVESNVSSLEGVDKVKVKFKDAEAKIKLDETKIPIDKVLEVITELGYEASSI